MRRVKITIVVFFACAGVLAEDRISEPTPNLPSTLQKGWHLLEEYSDEFNGSKLDKQKWDNDVRDWGRWSWKPSNIRVANGVLSVHINYKPHSGHRKRLYYESGIIRNNSRPILYGYFEARIKAAPKFPGVSPAFWAFRKTQEIWTEIDFVELTQRAVPRRIDTNVHVFRHEKLSGGRRYKENRSWDAPWDPRDDFHTFGCLWGPNYIRWYVDGKQVAHTKNRFWHQPLDIVVSMGLREPLIEEPEKLGFPTHFEVDYLRVWKKTEHDS